MYVLESLCVGSRPSENKVSKIYSSRGTFCPILAWSHSLTVPGVICDILL